MTHGMLLAHNDNIIYTVLLQLLDSGDAVSMQWHSEGADHPT